MADESDPKKETSVEEVQGGAGTEHVQPHVPEEKSIEAAKVEEKKEGERKLESDGVSIEAPNNDDGTNKEDPEKTAVEENPSLNKEETLQFSDLKEHEKKAFLALRAKLEEAILENKLFGARSVTKKEAAADQDKPSTKDQGEDKEKSEAEAAKEDADKGEGEGEQVKEEKAKGAETDKVQIDADGDREVTEGKGEGEQRNVELWGVPLLPSKGDKRTDVILLKFLRAKEFSANEAFEMLRKTLVWRKENRIDSILDEDLGADFGSIAYMQGKDKEGHPICYNIYGVLANEEVYEKILGSEEKREKFLRWRIQLMEKGIRDLDFKPSDERGVSTIVQISDLKNTPLPSRKELRVGIKKFVELFQDNYPEFVARKIFINVPFWYYAFSALFAPSLTQRTKNKFVYSRPARVTDTLLKYIAAEDLPAHYGGLKRQNETDFSTEDGAKDITIKANSTETIEIPAPEVGHALTWDVTVSGWEVNYREEFVPTDEKSYTVIVQRGRKIGWQDSSIRNTFVIKEPGKVVITIDNGSFKKKRVIYRYTSRTAPLPTSSA